MNIHVKYGLPFVSIIICYRGKELLLKHVLLDTGSASTIFSADVVDEIGVSVEPEDILNKIRAVGSIEVEIGEIDYGIQIDGILGFDFIQAANLIIDSKKLQITVQE